MHVKSRLGQAALFIGVTFFLLGAVVMLLAFAQTGRPLALINAIWSGGLALWCAALLPPAPDKPPRVSRMMTQEQPKGPIVADSSTWTGRR